MYPAEDYIIRHWCNGHMFNPGYYVFSNLKTLAVTTPRKRSKLQPLWNYHRDGMMSDPEDMLSKIQFSCLDLEVRANNGRATNTNPPDTFYARTR